MSEHSQAGGAQALTLARVRASEDFSKVAQPVFMRHLVRPLSWLFVVVMHRVGFTPNTVTTLRIVLTIIGVGVLCAGQPGVWFWLGLALVVQGVVLTAVDGCMSRVQNRASFFGKYFDGYMDALTEVLMYFALGVYQWQVSADAQPLLLGSLAAVTMALAQAGRVRHHLAAGNLAQARAANQAGADSGHPELLMQLDRGVLKFLWQVFGTWLPIVLWDIRYVGLAAAAVLGRLDVWLLVMAAGELLSLVGFLPLRVVRSYAEIDVHRYSQSATHT